MNDPALETRALEKTFRGGARALDGLDLEVPEGCTFGLLGRNGAGKTTAIRILMGLLRADGGTAAVLGRDLWAAEPGHRARVAYVAQSAPLFGGLSAADHADVLSRLYARWDGGYARALAGRFEVDWRRPVRGLSGGERRKLASILALAARPDVLVLDEPAAGLDPVARRDLIEALVDALAEGSIATVLLSTHIVSDLERIADRVGFIHRGRLLRAGSLDDLRRTLRRVQVVFEDGVPPDFTLPGAIRTAAEGPVVTAVAALECEEALDPVRALPGARVNVFPLGLEDLFIELVGRNGSDASRKEVTA